MEFIWKGKTPTIKSSTLCNYYDNGGLKNVDVFQNCKLTMLFDEKVFR